MFLSIPKGYRFAGVHCDVKPNTTKKDLALVVSDFPAVAAGVYTQNLVCGAPVQLDRTRTPGDGFRLVVTNSGVANACTGETGLKNAETMVALAAQRLGIPEDKGLVMSTGVIGIQLPMDRIKEGIEKACAALAKGEEAFMDAAHAIMTTDTVVKVASRTLPLSGGRMITLAGMCKGAAMIGPNMATMLCTLLTDASLTPEDAQQLLKQAADDSFNCISVEGHTSTSDSVVLLANGAACSSPLSGKGLELFAEALREIAVELAIKIPSDGEGISHLITIDVFGCRNRTEAKKIAQTIANDALVKSAICGADPNWGRITSAAGRAGVDFDPNKVSLKINGILLYKDGTPLEFDKEVVSNSIRDQKETYFEIFFAEGDAGIRFWTTDLTMEYVRLNSDYTT